jgi:RNA polymerase sigma-70 factor, ECF subfamily
VGSTVHDLVALTGTSLEGSLEEPDALVRRLAQGDARAVGEAYDQHHAAVRAFALRLVGDDAAAEDLVHDVFVALPKAIQRYRGESALRTFLISIAVNHSKHHLRSALRRRRAMERFAQEPLGASTDPEHDLRRKQLAELLVRALDQLPLDQRVAFVLSQVEERTSGEISEIVGAPEATVRTRVFHAKKRLQEFLERAGAAREGAA